MKLTSDLYEDLVTPEQFLSLYEAIQPKFIHGCNNPRFDDKRFYNDTKFIQTFIKVQKTIFLISFGAGIIKFAIVHEPTDNDGIMDLILKADAHKTKNVPYSVSAELFNSVLGVIIEYIYGYHPKSLSFSGLTPAHTSLYLRAAKNKRFVEIFNSIGYKVSTVHNNQIILEKE